MLDTQSGHHFMCGVRMIRVQHAFWTAYVSIVTAIFEKMILSWGWSPRAVILSFLSGT